MPFCYPEPKKDDVVEDYHGKKICDPYRWLEDPESAETQKFVESQNAISIPFLDKCKYKSKIKSRLTELWDYEKFSCPKQHGDYYYYYYNTGIQNQSVLYRQKTLTSEPTVFLDPNKLSDDGTVAISSSSFSEDGKYFAYGLSEKGSDWKKIKIKDTTTLEDFSEELEHVKFSGISWTHDNKGFFYSKFLVKDNNKCDGVEVSKNEHHKLYYHRIGTNQKDDILCAEFLEKPNWMINGSVSDCGEYLVLSIAEFCQDNMVSVCKLPEKISGPFEFTPIVPEMDAEYHYITNDGSIFLFHTNKGAPNYKLVKVDVSKEVSWTDFIPEHDQDVLDWASCVHNDKLIVCYMHDVKNIMEMYDMKTGEKKYNFPIDVGTISSYSGEKKLNELFYCFTSFLTPGMIYRVDLSKSLEPEIFRQIKVKNFNSNEFSTKQVFYESKDGTKIPMFIINRKDFQADGNSPCLLYGYGGFNISLQPSFSVSRLLFIQHFKGLLAIPNLRGGGEYGEKWHAAGRFGNKQNVFDDFQYAAKYLVENKYTSHKRLTIMGGSNGGLLVGACINQRPDLFGAAISQVGVMDMLRFHKFTIGRAWVSDYGSPDNPEHFDYLIKYSPLHNVATPKDENIEYPATLLLTADHDDRVSPLHSLKYIAQLQEVAGKCEKQKQPLMIKIDVKAGHGAGKPTSKVIDEITDIFCFISETLNLEYEE